MQQAPPTPSRSAHSTCLNFDCVAWQKFEAENTQAAADSSVQVKKQKSDNIVREANYHFPMHKKAEQVCWAVLCALNKLCFETHAIIVRDIICLAARPHFCIFGKADDVAGGSVAADAVVVAVAAVASDRRQHRCCRRLTPRAGTLCLSKLLVKWFNRHFYINI